ncbi:three-helix bundle dimerization domain-containing protein [Nocardia tengchongensis]
MVADVYRGFEGRPVRDFVPLLVERMATQKLVSTVC